MIKALSRRSHRHRHHHLHHRHVVKPESLRRHCWSRRHRRASGWKRPMSVVGGRCFGQVVLCVNGYHRGFPHLVWVFGRGFPQLAWMVHVRHFGPGVEVNVKSCGAFVAEFVVVCVQGRKLKSMPHNRIESSASPCHGRVVSDPPTSTCVP